MRRRFWRRAATPTAFETVTPEIGQRRIQWNADDIIQNRPRSPASAQGEANASPRT